MKSLDKIGDAADKASLFSSSDLGIHAMRRKWGHGINQSENMA